MTSDGLGETDYRTGLLAVASVANTGELLALCFFRFTLYALARPSVFSALWNAWVSDTAGVITFLADDGVVTRWAIHLRTASARLIAANTTKNGRTTATKNVTSWLDIAFP